MSDEQRFIAYVRWAALITVFLYSVGYSLFGFVLLLGGAIWYLGAKRTFLWQSTGLDLPLAVFGAVLLLSAAVSPYRLVAARVTLMLIISGGIYFGAFSWLLHRDPDSRMSLLRAWGFGAVAAALTGMANLISLHRERAEIEYPIKAVGPNALGTTLLLGSILSLGLGFRAHGRERTAWFASSLVCIVGLIATGSRASWIAWMVGVLYLVWQEFRTRPRTLVAVVALGTLVVGGAGFLTPQLAARLHETVRAGVGDRPRIWQLSAEMIRARPILGTGFGTFGTEYERWKDPGTVGEPFAYNLPLNIMAETGLLGFLSVLWVALTAARQWVQQARWAPPWGDPPRMIVAALWVGLLVDQLADNTLNGISTSAVLWLLLAWLVTPPVSAREGENLPRALPFDS